mgnify:CR=1 FL=1
MVGYEHTWYEEILFQLNWEMFTGHCLECGEWSHFMVEWRCHCPSAMNVVNEGDGKERVGRDVGMLANVVVMD